MSSRWARNAMYAGVGIGVIVFAFFGLLPGSFLGGAVGINIAGRLFGFPLETGILPKVIVAAAMVLGAVLSAIAIMSISSVLGWLAGYGLGWLAEFKDASSEAVEVKVKK